VPNAGVNELGTFGRPQLTGSKLIKPTFKTLEINLIGAMYTAHMGLYYTKKHKNEGDLKSIIFPGSMGLLLSLYAINCSLQTANLSVMASHPQLANVQRF